MIWLGYNKEGYNDIVRMLLDHGADVNNKNKYGQKIYLFEILTQFFYLNIIKIYFDQLILQNHLLCQNKCYLFSDIKFEQILKAKLSLNLTFTLRFRLNTNFFLHKRCFLEKLLVLNNLILHKGFTSLMLAARNGQVEVVQELIKYGADINTKNNQGKIIINHYLMHFIFFFILLVQFIIDLCFSYIYNTKQLDVCPSEA